MPIPKFPLLGINVRPVALVSIPVYPLVVETNAIYCVADVVVFVIEILVAELANPVTVLTFNVPLIYKSPPTYAPPFTIKEPCVPALFEAVVL